MKQSTTEIGTEAENVACLYLEKQGLKLVEKNFEVINQQGKKTGEIDLIMRDKQFYVFVEVKKRGVTAFGTAIEMITPQKKSRIIRTATHYLVRNYLFHTALCRFDVIGILYDKKPPFKQEITWIKDAFGVQY